MSQTGARSDGKIGLALSGGGFRAAFFHVGVLARLAEQGILPRVDAISTVSGGSIVGALYHIRLKLLLESKPDGAIGTDGYIGLVRDVELKLREAVQMNIRARVFANLLKNGAMLGRKYSRSDRIGDLYDRYLYKNAWERPRPKRSFGRDAQIEMRELAFNPHGTEGFNPKMGNRDREEKVPILVINATSLNSGHNWRFEATCMGESEPVDEDRLEVIEDVDKNMRLEQGYFPHDPPPPGGDRLPRIPKSQEDFPLALAVAASACVPGVFHPLEISDLYDGIRVQLVDGGVEDNQGIQALLDYGCAHLIVSDASGQMNDKDKPLPFLPFAVSGSSGIARDRIRDEQLVNTHDVSTLMHLRMGLEAEGVPPLENEASRDKGANIGPGPTGFGVDRRVQHALSLVRTDLDYFNDTEAFSLALDGYLMSAHQLKGGLLGRVDDTDADPPADRWGFWAMRTQLESPSDEYLRKLRAARKKFLRPFWLRLWAAAAVTAIAAVVLAVVVCAGHAVLAWAFDGPLWRALLAAAVALFLAPFAWSNVAARMTKLYE